MNVRQWLESYAPLFIGLDQIFSYMGRNKLNKLFPYFCKIRAFI